MKRLIALFFLCGFTGTMLSQSQDQKGAFNGLNMSLGNLSRLSRAKTRSISPENFTGEKGQGGMSTDGPSAKAARSLGQGWKVSPLIHINSGQTFTLAEIKGPGAIQHIWMTPTGHLLSRSSGFIGTERANLQSKFRWEIFLRVGGGNMLKCHPLRYVSIPEARSTLIGKCRSSSPAR
jgi:hypothetical protein